eukprot:355069-Chlamydomonas_euryale.AAC.1
MHVHTADGVSTDNPTLFPPPPPGVFLPSQPPPRFTEDRAAERAATVAGLLASGDPSGGVAHSHTWGSCAAGACQSSRRNRLAFADSALGCCVDSASEQPVFYFLKHFGITSLRKQTVRSKLVGIKGSSQSLPLLGLLTASNGCGLPFVGDGVGVWGVVAFQDIASLLPPQRLCISAAICYLKRMTVLLVASCVHALLGWLARCGRCGEQQARMPRCDCFIPTRCAPRWRRSRRQTPARSLETSCGEAGSAASAGDHCFCVARCGAVEPHSLSTEPLHTL